MSIIAVGPDNVHSGLLHASRGLACMTDMTRPALNLRSPTAVLWIQYPPVAIKANSTAQQYQSAS